MTFVWIFRWKVKSVRWKFWENRFGSFHFYTIPHTQFFKIPLVELIRALLVKKSIFRMFQWKTIWNENHAVENFFFCGLLLMNIRAITLTFDENSLTNTVFHKLHAKFKLRKTAKKLIFKATWWDFLQSKWKFV